MAACGTNYLVPVPAYLKRKPLVSNKRYPQNPGRPLILHRQLIVLYSGEQLDYSKDRRNISLFSLTHELSSNIMRPIPKPSRFQGETSR